MRKRVEWFPGVLLVAGILVAASACDTRPGGFSFATAGTATAGSSGQPGAGSQGGNRFATSANTSNTADPAAALKYSACVTYARTQCQRRFVDCGERSSAEQPCSASLDRCPDLSFSAGSTWTVESLLSCAEEWKTFSCDDIRQNKRPSCAQIKGTRQLEEPCLFPNQCASGSCTKLKKDGTGVSGYANCNVCGSLSALAGPCNVPGYDCALDLTCNSTQTCVKKASIGIVGATCDDDTTCGGYGVSCRKDPADGVKRCLTWPVAGESCADGFCSDGYYCSDAKVCVSAPALGEACRVKGPAQCAPGLVCSSYFDVQSYVCIAPRKLGEACLGDDVWRAPRGNCEVGLRCDCGELSCDLKSGICRQARGQGETCTDQNSMCVPGTTCIDGTCVALGPQPALAELCPE
jgi:hypothetical protein